MKAQTIDIYLESSTINGNSILVVPIIHADDYCEIHGGIHCDDGFCVVVSDKYIYVVPYFRGKLYCLADTCIPSLFRGLIIDIVKELIASESYGIIMPSHTYIFNENKTEKMDTQLIGYSMLYYLYVPVLDVIAKSLVILGYTLADFVEYYVDNAPYEYFESEDTYYWIMNHIPNKFKIIGNDNIDRITRRELLGTVGALFPKLAVSTLLSFINTNDIEKTIEHQYNKIISTLLEAYTLKKQKQVLSKHIDKIAKDITSNMDNVIEEIMV